MQLYTGKTEGKGERKQKRENKGWIKEKYFFYFFFIFLDKNVLGGTLRHFQIKYFILVKTNCHQLSDRGRGYMIN